MPTTAKKNRSRRLSVHGVRLIMATPRINTPATRKRAVSRSSGGQSVTAALATAKAALQRTQNVTTITGSGSVQEADWAAGTAGSAERMGISFRAAIFMARAVHLEIK